VIPSLSVGSLDAASDDALDRRKQLVAEGAKAFRREGCLLLEDALDRGFVERLHSAFNDRHAHSGSSGQPRGSLRVGHQRYMITVRLRKPFTDSRLFANPVLFEVLTELLGADWVLFSFGAVVSYPGAEDQHVHSDGGSLFGDSAVEGGLPPYAITAIVPLVDMNAETGTTRVWPGSQGMTKDDLQGVAPHDPLVPVGSVLLMDYRLHHGGLANRSAGARPILSLVFTRPWFRDVVNFTEQPPLSYGLLQRVRMPPDLRRLLPAEADPSLGQRVRALGHSIVAKARRNLVRA
jgi:ectoine hydroxylase-related dioxygenase (phytanoyl-CoA dioxygenase family)